MAGFWKWLLNWDVGDIAVGGGWHLRFVADYGNYLKLAFIAVLAALVYLTIRSYRREGEASRRAKAVLATIRIVVILLLFGILFQPAVVRPDVKTITKDVVVLWDDSQSMGLKDRYAEANAAGERAVLARRLGVPPQRVSELTRMEIVQKALAEPLARLAADHPQTHFRFSATRPASGGSDTRQFGTLGVNPRQDPNEISRLLAGALTGSGYSTNLPQAIGNAMDMTAGRRLAAIVVPTDGQMTVAGATSGFARILQYAKERGVQIIPVLVGDPTPPKNLAVTALQGPLEARRGAEIEFTATLYQRNLGGETVTVKLQRRKGKEGPWEETPVASETVQLEKGGAEANAASGGLQSVVLRTKPDELGDFEYKAVVEARADEENVTDNWAAAPVRIVEEKIRVLLVSGDAGKEFQYLRNYLQRNQDDYLVSIWQQNADANVNQTSSSGMKLERLPRSLDELIGVPGDKDKPGYNVIILYDPQHTEGGFDKHFVEELLKPFVHDHHGGLCYVAGNKYTSLSVLKHADFASLRDLLSITLAEDKLAGMSYRLSETKPEPWQVRLTAYGMDHPVTRLGATAEASRDLWPELPGVYWSYPVQRPKPGARVLATSSDPQRRTARNEALPLVVVQPYGRGSVLYVGFDETWRWYPVKDGLYHRNFWGNVVRYLASLQSRRVTISTGGAKFSVGGEAISIEVEAYDEGYKPLKKDSVLMRVNDANSGSTVETLTLKRVEGKDGEYRFSYEPKRPGRFQLVADVESGDPNGPVSKEIEIRLPDDEFVRREADPATLRSLAWPPEKFLLASQADRLQEIPSLRWTEVGPDEQRSLWDTNLALVMIVVLLAVEWILRKKHNMA